MENYRHLWKADLTLLPFPTDNVHSKFTAAFASSWHYSSVSLQANDQEAGVLRISNVYISMDVSLLVSQGITEHFTKSCESE